jgi:ribosomal protein L40E
MLEIIGLFFLARRNGRAAAEKGYDKVPIIVMTVILWVGLEVLGVVVGISVSDELGPILLCGIMGATVGAIASVIITNNLQNKKIPDSATAASESAPVSFDNKAVAFKEQWICKNCGAQNAVFDDEKCFKCGELKPQQQEDPLD